jgi:hypothetical protein
LFNLDPDRREAMIRNLERVAWLMDRAFHIPGTRIRVGLDALLSLLPIGGDVLTGLVQAGAANVLIDIPIGAIPVLGDLFDAAFKANSRTIQLLEPYRHPAPIAVESPRPSRTMPLTLEFKPVAMPWRYIVPGRRRPVRRLRWCSSASSRSSAGSSTLDTRPRPKAVHFPEERSEFLPPLPTHP